MNISSRFLNLPLLASNMGFINEISSVLRFEDPITGKFCYICYSPRGSFNDSKLGLVNAPFFLYCQDYEEDTWHYMSGEAIVKLYHDLTLEMICTSQTDEKTFNTNIFTDKE